MESLRAGFGELNLVTKLMPRPGANKFLYVRVGEDHFSLAFTYAWMAAQDRFLRELHFEWIA